MTMVLTATADPGNNPPRVLLTVTGAPGTTVTVVRVNADRSRDVVRETDGGKQLTGGAANAYDYEVQYGVPATYVATANDSSGTSSTSAPVTVAAGPWLLHPGIPDLSQPITVRLIGDETYDTGDGVHYVLGREKPIVISDGVRHSPTFDVVVKTTTTTDAEALRELLADSSPLLLQVSYGYSDELVYRWVTVGQVVRAPLNRFVHPTVLWTLPCTEVDAPVGALQDQRTIADVTAQFAGRTLADIAATYLTLRDLYIDTQAAAGTDAADTIVVTDNGDGTLTLTGPGVVDNGDGTLTLNLTSPGDVDNGDGTITLV